MRLVGLLLVSIWVTVPFSASTQDWNLGFHGVGSMYPDPSGAKLPEGKAGGFRDFPWKTGMRAVMAKEQSKPEASTAEWLLYRDRLLDKECLVNYDFHADQLVEGSYNCQFHAPYGAPAWKEAALKVYAALREKYGVPSYETIQSQPLGEIRVEERAFSRFFSNPEAFATQVAWHFKNDFVHFDVISKGASSRYDVKISYGVNEAEQLRASRDKRLRPPMSRTVAENLKGKL